MVTKTDGGGSMKNWNVKKLQQLKKAGRIRGYKVGGAKKKVNALPVKKRSKGLTWLETNLQHWCKERSLQLVREHKFCEDRKWRFDYALPAYMIAVEYEGGIYQVNSGHKTAKHYTKDTDKYNRAAAEGWRVIRVTAVNYKSILSTLKSMI